MEYATSPREDVEAKLYLLLLVNTFQVKVLLLSDEVGYSPIEPCEAHLDVKIGVLGVPILRVIDLIDLLQYVKFLVFCGQGMEKRGLIVLTHPYEAF